MTPAPFDDLPGMVAKALGANKAKRGRPWHLCRARRGAGRALLTTHPTPPIRPPSGRGGRPDADIKIQVDKIRALYLPRSSGNPPRRSPRNGNDCGICALRTRKGQRTETARGRSRADTCVEKRGKRPNANDPAADPQAAAAQSKKPEVDAPSGVPAKARRLHACLHHHAEEAELGHA